MSNYIVKRLTDKYKIQNFNTFFIFGKDNNISLLKKFHRFVFNESGLIGSNKELGLPKIIKNLEVKYKIKAVVKKELSKAIK